MPSSWIKNELLELRKDPKTYIKTPPPEKGCNPDAPLLHDARLFNSASTLEDDADVENVSDPRQLIGHALQFTTPQQIKSAKLSTSKVKTDVWSGSDWPVSRGSLGRRYADPEFEKVVSWQDRYRYVQDHPIPATNRNLLSPSEKYDILVGNGTSSLTKFLWEEGQTMAGYPNGIPDWAGICDGWAAAAYLLKRPRREVEVTAADGKQLIFYPSDIKALASQLWAAGMGQKNKPKRILGRGDAELHPGAWHLAIVNQVGGYKSVLIADLAAGPRAFNYPIVEYSFQYFNPQEAWNQNSRLVAGPTSLEKGIVSRGAFVNDPSLSRNKNTKSVLGIAMCVTYVGNPQPQQSLTDATSRSERSSVGYLYDIEMDHSNSIIGGYWYKHKNFLPHLLWLFPEGTQAETKPDKLLKEKWQDPRMPPPKTWRRAAGTASAGGTPLAAVVNALIGFANAART